MRRRAQRLLAGGCGGGRRSAGQISEEARESGTGRQRAAWAGRSSRQAVVEIELIPWLRCRQVDPRLVTRLTRPRMTLSCLYRN